MGIAMKFLVHGPKIDSSVRSLPFWTTKISMKKNRIMIRGVGVEVVNKCGMSEPCNYKIRRLTQTHNNKKIQLD